MNDEELNSVVQATFDEIPGATQSIDLAQYSALVEAHPMMLSQLTLNVSSLVAEQAGGQVL